MEARQAWGWKRAMARARLAAAGIGVAAVAIAMLTGCTLYPEQKQPSLMQTTSAEQVDRIFWQEVEQGKWIQANALLAPNAVWRVDGQVVAPAQIIPWLQSLGIHGAQVSNIALTPAVNDMNLVYTVQLQAEKAVAAQVGAGCAGHPQTLSALAVWQQPQPTGKTEKTKEYRGYLLTVHDLTTGNGDCR
jgi:hypothetical protein